MQSLLEVCNLTVKFASPQGWTTAVYRASFTLDAGSVLALVGESSAGKTSLALAILRLLPPGIARVTGTVLFNGVDLLGMTGEEIQLVRGNEIGMIFQEPASALNPLLPVGAQVAEPLEVHRGMKPRDARQEAVKLLGKAGLPDPALRARDYPHQLSGGMRQRVMVAAALACDPVLLIADEPTSALDVMTQSRLLDVLRGIQLENDLAVLLVSHDLGVVAAMADQVAVMHEGRILETTPVGELFEKPRHPHTRALVAAACELSGGDP